MNSALVLSAAATALLTLLCAPAQAQAQTDNCEPIRASIEARMRAGGLPVPQLQVVDSSATLAGRVVGSCGNGARKIVHTGAGAAGTPANAVPAAPLEAERRKPRPAAGKDDNIPTECRDGTVVMGPNCSDVRAPRLPGVGVVADQPAPAASR